jgi:hypothetical protein
MSQGSAWNKGTNCFTKTDSSATENENVVITLLGGNAISLTVSSGYTPPAPEPNISASVTGSLNVGATISVSLFNGAE